MLAASVADTIRRSAINTVIRSPPKGHTDSGITYSIEHLYIYPELCRTGRRKKGEVVEFSIRIPKVFDFPELSRIYRFKKGDKQSVTRIKGQDMIFYPENPVVPLTMIYDSVGNLIFFKHYFYGDTQHIPEIDGCYSY